ncbi:hypothetical protein GPECTOR_7g1100 [Gonium pectorale]|uniref:Uncharacterized protein n=1 Tax=Gonium pectorale TaxID=33097 RepID=A0A150GTM1_GONPE|nr:hypothetical protein GPECTOR_7g1100 [Gonium pectorale]|eukprot:KXZ53207.1 hypothetical protein GPECTOR_7g1100 [Gonium pectorale]
MEKRSDLSYAATAGGGGGGDAAAAASQADGPRPFLSLQACPSSLEEMAAQWLRLQLRLSADSPTAAAAAAAAATVAGGAGRELGAPTALVTLLAGASQGPQQWELQGNGAPAAASPHSSRPPSGTAAPFLDLSRPNTDGPGPEPHADLTSGLINFRISAIAAIAAAGGVADGAGCGLYDAGSFPPVSPRAAAATTGLGVGGVGSNPMPTPFGNFLVSPNPSVQLNPGYGPGLCFGPGSAAQSLRASVPSGPLPGGSGCGSGSGPGRGLGGGGAIYASASAALAACQGGGPLLRGLSSHVALNSFMSSRYDSSRPVSGTGDALPGSGRALGRSVTGPPASAALCGASCRQILEGGPAPGPSVCFGTAQSGRCEPSGVGGGDGGGGGGGGGRGAWVQGGGSGSESLGRHRPPHTNLLRRLEPPSPRAAQGAAGQMPRLRSAMDPFLPAVPTTGVSDGGVAGDICVQRTASLPVGGGTYQHPYSLLAQHIRTTSSCDAAAATGGGGGSVIGGGRAGTCRTLSSLAPGAAELSGRPVSAFIERSMLPQPPSPVPHRTSMPGRAQADDGDDDDGNGAAPSQAAAPSAAEPPPPSPPRKPPPMGVPRARSLREVLAERCGAAAGDGADGDELMIRLAGADLNTALGAKLSGELRSMLLELVPRSAASAAGGGPYQWPLDYRLSGELHELLDMMVEEQEAEEVQGRASEEGGGEPQPQPGRQSPQPQPSQLQQRGWGADGANEGDGGADPTWAAWCAFNGGSTDIDVGDVAGWAPGSDDGGDVDARSAAAFGFPSPATAADSAAAMAVARDESWAPAGSGAPGAAATPLVVLNPFSYVQQAAAVHSLEGPSPDCDPCSRMGDPESLDLAMLLSDTMRNSLGANTMSWRRELSGQQPQPLLLQVSLLSSLQRTPTITATPREAATPNSGNGGVVDGGGGGGVMAYEMQGGAP